MSDSFWNLRPVQGDRDSFSRLLCVVLRGEGGCRRKVAADPEGTGGTQQAHQGPAFALGDLGCRDFPSPPLKVPLGALPGPLVPVLVSVTDKPSSRLTRGPRQASPPLWRRGPSRCSGETAPGPCPQRSSSVRRRKRSYYSSAESIRLEASQKQPQLQPLCEVTTNKENLCCQNKMKLQCIRQHEQVFTRKVRSPREQPQWNCNQVS